ncbi:isochorismatase family protein [Streptomyces sp. NPDC089919]|uniref:isochorismatase family protein n=1 Tax=Streptomyces sp. NPDC089919 TaxID=3155188 RepID=UPI003421B428
MATFTVQVEEYSPADLLDHCGGPPWEPSAGRAALLVHDLQPYYLDVLAPGVRSWLCAGVERALSWADRHGVPVLASRPRPAREQAQRGLLGSLWGLGPSSAQAHEAGVPRLAGVDVTWIAKRSYSAFYATDLAAELRRTGRDQLVVTGVYASAGILATSFDALARDVEVFVPVAATADYTARHHVRGLDSIAALTGRVLPDIG